MTGDGYDWVERLAIGFIGVCAVFAAGLMVLVCWSIYDNAVADKFSLRKDRWECSQSHYQTTYGGRVPITTLVCDQWSRKHD